MKKTKLGRTLPLILFIVTGLLITLVIMGALLRDIAILSTIGPFALIAIGICVVYCMADIFDKLPKWLLSFIFLPLLLTLQSCVTSEDKQQAKQKWVENHIITIRGCDYAYDTYTMVHAGDCPNPIHHQMVDLPEEYMEISQDKAHPDTMLAFRDNDITYITFTGKHR